MGTVRPPHRLRSRAFSLVEMLTVIVIIGILGSMITAAVIKARTRAHEAAIKIELGKLENALGMFKEKYGEYPPDFSDQTQVVNFLARAFPRYAPDWSTFTTHVGSAVANSETAADLNPSNALVFWLGGFNSATYPDTPVMTGFSANVGKPIEKKATTSSRVGPFLEFDTARLKYDTAKWPVYVPPGNGAIANTPYIYFRAIGGTTAAAAYTATTKWTTSGDTRITPYYSSVQNGFAAPTTYQIISAGLDGKFGSTASGYSTYPGAGATGGHADNVTSFTKATTIDSEK